MATGTYSLYAGDGTTPVAVKKPSSSDWKVADRGQYGSGKPRTSPYKQVVWRWDVLSASEYNAIEAARQVGKQNFETWRRTRGATAAGFVVCSGFMSTTISATYTGGEYRDVTLTWTMVLEV